MTQFYVVVLNQTSTHSQIYLSQAHTHKYTHTHTHTRTRVHVGACELHPLVMPMVSPEH